MNNTKRLFPTELAYVLGLIILALSTSMMAAADFGLSMVVAPAYILHLKISEFLPFFSFGMAEYSFQAILLVIISLILRRFKLSYLFSFVTAFLYSLILDCCILIIGMVPMNGIVIRIAFYLVGMFFCAVGVSLFFRTYISPEAYELFVKEVSSHLSMDISKFKTAYDCASCLLSILLSFAFFGLWHFEGVKLGTIFCALVNGYVIGQCSKFLDRFWRFEDCLPLRPLFEK